MKLFQTNMTPPTGWSYVQFQTGHRFNEPDFEAIVEAVRAHRWSNNLPRQSKTEVMEDVETQICSRSPSHVCRGADFEPASLSASTVHNAMKALASTWKDTPLVPQDEANRRADICRRCPFNQPVHGCFGVACNETMRILFETINRGRQTPSDDNLMGCSCCGCSCKVIVHFPLDVLRQATPDDRQRYFNRTEHCWRNENNLASPHS